MSLRTVPSHLVPSPIIHIQALESRHKRRILPNHVIHSRLMPLDLLWHTRLLKILDIRLLQLKPHGLHRLIDPFLIPQPNNRIRPLLKHHAVATVAMATSLLFAISSTRSTIALSTCVSRLRIMVFSTRFDSSRGAPRATGDPLRVLCERPGEQIAGRKAGWGRPHGMQPTPVSRQ